MTQTSSGSNTGALNGGATGTTVGSTAGANKGATQTIESVSTGTTMRAVTISREYGSGGGEIAARLSKRLGWKLIHHEIVMQVANALGVSQEDAAAHDEN